MRLKALLFALLALRPLSAGAATAGRINPRTRVQVENASSRVPPSIRVPEFNLPLNRSPNFIVTHAAERVPESGGISPASNLKAGKLPEALPPSVINAANSLAAEALAGAGERPVSPEIVSKAGEVDSEEAVSLGAEQFDGARTLKTPDGVLEIMSLEAMEALASEKRDSRTASANRRTQKAGTLTAGQSNVVFLTGHGTGDKTAKAKEKAQKQGRPTPIHETKKGRQDYKVGTIEEAVALALELAEIDAAKAEKVFDEDGNLIGYRDEGAEVHFHPSDLKGHPRAKGATPDPISESPHVNYANWKHGKKGNGGKFGHILFTPAR